MENSQASAEAQCQGSTNKSLSEFKPLESNATPLFRVRKRSQKARKKRSLERNKGGVDEDEGISKTDLLLLKEAQVMREKIRLAALDTGLSGRKRKSYPEQAEVENDGNNTAALGLRNNFAVERSNNVMEEHMKNYIEEGIRKKFGQQETGGSLKNSHDLQEENLYAIPEHLKVEERQQYDPGEGMPTAGVEEIELPEHVRRKNEIETLRAREKLEEQCNIEGRPKSSNSACIEDKSHAIFGLSKGSSSDPNTTYCQQGHRQTHQAAQTDIPNTKKRRFRHATDNLVADRFRKRWRR
ncbi:unnamed protein product [Agarophyton chilense]